MSPQHEHHLHVHLRRKAILRLVGFFAILLIVGLAITFGGFVHLNSSSMRAQVNHAGPLGPLAFVLISGIGAALFIPGPIFAAAGGALFGAMLGIPLGILGAVLCALIGREVGARMGREAAEDLAGAKLGQLTMWLDRYGLTAVIAMRLAPAMPDAPLNYAAGLTRLRRWQIALGTAIGSIPRTLGWGLIGATAGGGSGWLATAGLALIVGADVVGVLAAILMARWLGVSPRSLWRRMRGQPAVARSPKLAAMRIAIDGPAGAGKSTVARLVAERVGFTYLDTGAMFRCAALAALRGAEEPGKVDIEFQDGQVLLDGEDVSLAIRSAEVTSLASQIAAAPAVREALAERQRTLMATGAWVAEGRDIGTVIVPDAELKIFLDADPLERAQRRAVQLGANVETVLAQQNERDERDRTRVTAPLVAAADAVVLDTSGLNVDQVVDRIVQLAEERQAAAANAQLPSGEGKPVGGGLSAPRDAARAPVHEAPKGAAHPS